MTTKITPITCEVIKTGKATKDGKTFDWALSRVEADEAGKRRTFSTFDDFNAVLNTEIEVEVEEKVTEKNGKSYTNYNIKLPRRNVWRELDELRNRIEKLERLATLPKVEEVLPDVDAEGFDESQLPF